MKLKKFKERDNKRIGIIVFTIACILLVSGVILYRTFAIFEVKINQNVINGTVQDPGNIYFAFYQKNEESGVYEIKKDMPNLQEGYVLDEEASYCGVNGEKDQDIKVYLTEDGYIKVGGMKTSRTKCNLYFTKGVFIQGKGIPVVESGDGLYTVDHNDLTNEENGILAEDLAGWKQTEWRYGGAKSNNYVWFNCEEDYPKDDDSNTSHCEIWRIIGLVNVKTENRNIEQRIKLVRNDSIGNINWDNSSQNDWTKASLMKYLNSGEYYINGLKDQAKGMIAKDIIWNIGGYSTPDITTVAMYGYERGTKVYQSRPTEWSKDNTVDGTTYHSIGLIYPSDYGYAVGGTKENRDICVKSTNLGSYNSCTENNWVWDSWDHGVWSITPNSDYGAPSFMLGSRMSINGSNASVPSHPTVYLSSKVTISGGKGTTSEPYILSGN